MVELVVMYDMGTRFAVRVTDEQAKEARNAWEQNQLSKGTRLAIPHKMGVLLLLAEKIIAMEVLDEPTRKVTPLKPVL